MSDREDKRAADKALAGVVKVLRRGDLRPSEKSGLEMARRVLDNLARRLEDI